MKTGYKIAIGIGVTALLVFAGYKVMAGTSETNGGTFDGKVLGQTPTKTGEKIIVDGEEKELLTYTDPATNQPVKGYFNGTIFVQNTTKSRR